MLRKVVVAIDSFKGSLTSAEATGCCAQAIREVCHGCEVVEIPTADGGEGFAEVAARSPLYRPIETTAHNPLGAAVTARYFLNDTTHTAVIEMAQACALTLVPVHLRNPMRTSSAGLGDMMRDAINRHAKNIIIGIGGSATNDGGMGMLCALGFKFRDCQGHELAPCGASLNNIHQIDTSHVPDNIFKTSILVACDVDNPFYGEQGATYVYGPQKGATAAMLDELEAGMRNFARVISDMGHPEIATCRGGGAAGGVGGTLHTLLGARLEPGIDVVLHLTDFDEQARDADLIITGEGKLDHQTHHGKTPAGILRHAHQLGIPVIALCGQLADPTLTTNHPTNLSTNPSVSTNLPDDMGFLACLSIINKPATLSQCTDKTITKHNLKHTTRQLINIINHYTSTINKQTKHQP